MLFSLALMVLCGLVLSGTMQKLKLPGLVGMLLTGIVLGPYVLNLIEDCVQYSSQFSIGDRID